MIKHSIYHTTKTGYIKMSISHDDLIKLYPRVKEMPVHEQVEFAGSLLNRILVEEVYSKD